MATPRKIRCLAAGVLDHGEHVYTVDLTPERPLPAFLPGQFLHLTLDAYDPSGFWPESRVFSIASSPQRRETLRICYSVKGVYTASMERELRPGVAVRVKLPSGDGPVRYRSGRITLESIGGHVADPLLADCFLSGPPAMIEALSADIRKCGIGSEGIHVDAWA